MEEKHNARDVLGWIVKGLLAATVLTFLGLHTYNFFTYTFKAENWYYAFLGFGLTGLAAIGYLYLFMKEQDSSIRKVISLLMVFICFGGEIMAAGFGMQIEVWKKSGWELTQQDFNFMLLSVQVLAFIHALALIGHIAGEKIVATFTEVGSIRFWSTQGEEAELAKNNSSSPNPTPGKVT